MSKTIQNGEFHSKRTNSWKFPNQGSFHLIVVLFFFIVGISKAQAQDYTSTNKKALAAYESAMTAFDLRNHELAIAYLDEAIDKDKGFIEAYLLKFEVYSEMQDLPKAEEALEDAFAINPDFYRNGYFFLGLLEMEQGKYAEAKEHLQKFQTYSNLNPEMVYRANKELANCEFAEYALEHPVPFEPQNLGEAINSADPEYYPSVTADEHSFVFTRLVKDARSYGGKNENVMMSNMRQGTWFPAFPIQELNTEYNEGAPSVSGDGKILVFTACELMGEYGSGREGFGSCDLFISEKVNGVWQAPVNMGPPVNTKYWETQPSLSADGKGIYFIRGVPEPNGVKDQDIYYSNRRDDGSWSIPVKLSPRINTQEKEESVFIHPDGTTLYFSSEGHPGMGGLDLFMSKLDTLGRWTAPVNLGYPINTYKDENSILVSPSGELAYFASNRDNGFGDLDLYSFNLHKRVQPIPVTFVKGTVKDGDTGNPVGSLLTLTDLDANRKKLHFTSDSISGEFLVAIATDTRYAVTIKAPGYLLKSENFSLSKSPTGGGYEIDLAINKIETGKSVVLQNLYFDTDKDVIKKESLGELREFAEFLVANPGIKIELEGHTDSVGTAEYNMDLSQRRADAVRRFLVEGKGIEEDRVVAKGYGSTKPVAPNDTEEGRARNRRTVFRIVEVQ